MKIYYEKGHEDSRDEDWIIDESKDETVKGISVEEVIERLKSFVTDHPRAYIQADTQICVFDYDKERSGGYSLLMRAEGDEVPT